MINKLNNKRIEKLKSAPHNKKCKVFWLAAWNEMMNKSTKDILER